MIDDKDVWDFIDPEDLWIYDKLILSKRLKYDCGPAGVNPSKHNRYIVRPCVNFRMMGRNAKIIEMSSESDLDLVPDGFFWCEVFEGRHLSFDFYKGKQHLAVEGFRDSERLDRFSRWSKVDDTFILPDVLQPVASKYEWLNVEVIGDKVIEVHLRYNDDFSNHNSNEIIPIWKENFYSSPCGDRIGFLLR